MPLLQGRFVRQGLLILTASGLIFGATAHVQAADEGGLGGILQQLFSPRPAPPSQPPPTLVGPSSVRGRVDDTHRRHVWRQSVRRHYAKKLQPQIRSKERYATLSKAERVRPVVEKPKPSAMRPAVMSYARDPDGALLHDSTLRRGDIVITTVGAKVFTGRPQERHAASEFEPMLRSTVIRRKTRALVAAMVAPHGALPASAAAKVMAKLHPLPAADGVPAQAQASTLRVVYPMPSQQGSVKVSLQGR